MKGFNFLHVKPAASKLEPHDLSFDHLTTMDFGQIVPLACIESVPRDSFKIKANIFSRLAPMVKPAYGRFYFKTASFFVPEFMLADSAEAYHAGNSSYEGVTADLRWFTYYQYYMFLYNISEAVNANLKYDYTFIANNGTKVYRKFTSFGRYAIKVMNALGYAIPENMDLRTDSVWYSTFYSKKINAMPLLAFAKAYNDYMSRSTRYNTSGLTSLLRSIKHNVAVSQMYQQTDCTLLAKGIESILSNIKLCYENDYFMSAWQSPSNPINVIQNPNNITVPGTASDSITNTFRDTTLDLSVDDNQVQLNQRSIDFLRRFDDWVRRFNYSGSRTYQKILSQFGIKTSDFRSNYAELINTTSDLVRVGDVTVTATTDYVADMSTQLSYVGDYAGKGILQKDIDISYKSNDYGYLLIFGYFTVAPMYPYGFDRSVLRTSPFDFYTPQFDGVGADAISYGELFTSQVPNDDDVYLDDAVYGFTERYNSYRFGRDKITGDFRSTNPNSTMNCWHNGRLLNDVRAAGQMVAQSESMVYLPQYDSEYNRIFSVPGGLDHFYVTAQFDIPSMRPIKTLNQVPRLDEGDTVIPRNGNALN